MHSDSPCKTIKGLKKGKADLPDFNSKKLLNPYLIVKLLGYNSVV